MSPFTRRTSLRRADRELARAVLLLLLVVFVLTQSSGPRGEVAEQRHLAACELLGLTDPSPDTEAAWRGAPVEVLSRLPLLALGEGLARLEEDRIPSELVGGLAARPDALPRLTSSLGGPLIAAACGWLLVLVARRIGARRRPAWITGMAFGLSTFVWPASASSQGRSDLLAALLLLVGFHCLVRIRESYERLRDPRRSFFASCGLSLVLPAGIRPALALPGAWLLLLALLVTLQGHRRLQTTRWTRDARAGGFLLDLALLLLPGCVLWPLLLWDTTLPAPVDAGRALEAMLGLLVSPGHGLLLLAPGLLLLPFGVLTSWRGGERLWSLASFGCLALLLVPAGLEEAATGPLGFGPVRLLPALPLLFAGLALVPQEGRSGFVRTAWGGLAVLGMMVQLPAAIVDQHAEQDLAILALEVEAERMEALGLGGEAVAERLDPLRLVWSPGFAEPLTTWRILRREAAVGDGRFPSEEVFLLSESRGLELEPGRPVTDLGLAVIHRRWPRMFWLGLSVLGGAALYALVLAARGLDPRAA